MDLEQDSIVFKISVKYHVCLVRLWNSTTHKTNLEVLSDPLEAKKPIPVMDLLF